MDKYEIAKRIEEFAPLETQEDWDCSGWAIDVKGYDEINKIMICLTVTEDIIKQAKAQSCNLIISHHPCFYVPVDWSGMNIYCAHTNLDKAKGGTTDTLIENLGLSQYKIPAVHEFLRIIEYNVTVEDFNKLLKTISPNARIINNKSVKKLQKIAFCAGSGSEFVKDAKEFGCDCLVTGDLKFHTALDSDIVVYDVGHFESEILVLPKFKKIIGDGVDFVYGEESSPFRQI